MMLKSPKIVALVPMRHHSKRVPGKNYRMIGGKPLFHHILTSLQHSSHISDIVVDTDSPAVMEGISKHFPKVIILKRPENLCADTIPMNEILLYDTSQVEADLYLQTHSTNPLLKTETISKAIEVLLGSLHSFDSLFSVTRLQTRLWDALTRPVNHNPSILLRTQDLPPIYEENSCIYLFSRNTLVQRRNRIGERPYLFEIDRAEALDIDDELDFMMADLVLTHVIKPGLV